MFEYSIAEVSAQLYGQPLGLVMWVRWLGLVNLMIALFFIRNHVPARWVLAAMLFIMATNIPMSMSLGLVKVLGIPHIIAWLPLVIYLANLFRIGAVELKSKLGIWLAAVIATDITSIVFDVRDGVEYILGDRAIVNVDSSQMPYITLVVLAASLAVAFIYSRPRADA